MKTDKTAVCFFTEKDSVFGNVEPEWVSVTSKNAAFCSTWKPKIEKNVELDQNCVFQEAWHSQKIAPREVAEIAFCISFGVNGNDAPKEFYYVMLGKIFSSNSFETKAANGNLE